MVYNYSKKEIQYIQKNFLRVKQLLGVERPRFLVSDMKKSLIEKGVIIEKPDAECELRKDIQEVFTAWAQKTSSIVVMREKEGADAKKTVLWNDDGVMLVEWAKDEYSIRVIDEDITSALSSFTGVDAYGDSREVHIARFTESDAANMLTAHSRKKDLTKWATLSNVDAETLEWCLTMLDGDTGSFAMVEDRVANVGALTKYISTPRGIIAYMHVTPEDKENYLIVALVTKERIVQLLKNFD